MMKLIKTKVDGNIELFFLNIQTYTAHNTRIYHSSSKKWKLKIKMMHDAAKQKKRHTHRNKKQKRKSPEKMEFIQTFAADLQKNHRDWRQIWLFYAIVQRLMDLHWDFNQYENEWKQKTLERDREKRRQQKTFHSTCHWNFNSFARSVAIAERFSHFCECFETVKVALNIKIRTRFFSFSRSLFRSNEADNEKNRSAPNEWK